jgi:dipeptidyl aminopeptidase/acylaminoacyl peptidase
MESTIWLFDSAAVSAFAKLSSGKTGPIGRKLAAMGTLSNGEAITEARWAADSGSIAFLGRNKGAERHLFVVSVKDGQIKQLSSNGHDVTRFDRAADTFVFTAMPAVTDAKLYESAGPNLPDLVQGTGLSIFKLLYPEWENFTFGGHPNEVWQVRNGNASPVKASLRSAPISLVSDSFAAVLSISPRGRYAVVTNAAVHVPVAWESYQAGYKYQQIAADKAGTKPIFDRTRPAQYELIDLQSGRISPLMDAPIGRSAGYGDMQTALWLNGEEVILTSTFLPQEGKNATGLPHSLRPWVVTVNVASGKINCIEETPVREEVFSVRLSGVEWQAPDRRLVLRYIHSHDNSVGVELFQEQNGTWTGVTDPNAVHAAEKKSPARDLSIDVQQSVNEPPVLVAAVAGGGPKKIWDPNPQFARLKLGEATVYKWRDEDGNEWAGGLVKPPDYVTGRRYPLVIQTHGFNQKEFLTDGYYPTANAARPMAAREIVVLQIGEISLSDKTMESPQEPATMRKGYVAAIQKLDAEGMIDPHKVGIIGFSRTGWYVLDSLLHAKEYFAAATLAECTHISFGEYIMNADYGGPGRAKSIAAGIGPEPFGEGLQKWIDASAGFNTDKIDAPVLFQENSPVALIYSWDMYALMRLQNKPVDLLYFRNGEHVLAKPLEQLISQETNVDWYDFWLNGHEDSDPAKADQYARWRELRKLQKQKN